MRCHLLRYHSVTLRYITLRGKAECNLCLPGLPGPGPSEAAVTNANPGLEVLRLFKVKPEGQTIRYPDNSPPRQFAPDIACVAGGSGCPREPFCGKAANSLAGPARGRGKFPRLLSILLATCAAVCTHVRDRSSRGYPLTPATQATPDNSPPIFRQKLAPNMKTPT